MANLELETKNRELEEINEKVNMMENMIERKIMEEVEEVKVVLRKMEQFLDNRVEKVVTQMRDVQKRIAENEKQVVELINNNKGSELPGKGEMIQETFESLREEIVHKGVEEVYLI